MWRKTAVFQKWHGICIYVGVPEGIRPHEAGRHGLVPVADPLQPGLPALNFPKIATADTRMRSHCCAVASHQQPAMRVRLYRQNLRMILRVMFPQGNTWRSMSALPSPTEGEGHSLRRRAYLASAPNNACNSPASYISIMISLPPTNSPPTYSCGIVGQSE